MDRATPKIHRLGSCIKGDMYPASDEQYDYRQLALGEDGTVFESDEDGWDWVPCEDAELIARVKRLAAEDAEVLAQRDAIAKQQADGDPLLEAVIRQHLWFTDGWLDEPHALVPDGHTDSVDFYMVGRNASHQFSVGTKDGRRFTYSAGESCEEDEDGIPGLDESCREVEEWGYIGHS
jgi:hypothetical protein